MNKKKLARLRREIEGLRRAKHNIGPRDLTSLAKKLVGKKLKEARNPRMSMPLSPKVGH